MKVLLAPTESFIKREKTFLSAAASAGGSVVVNVQNATNFSINDYVVIGLEGSEQAELTQITAVTNETLTLLLLKLNHISDEPIVKYRYNQRKFYGATVSGGSYTHLSSYGSPATIQVDVPQNTICEYTGSEGYIYFKSTYYNSTTSEETSLGDATEVLANESLRYCSNYAIRKQAGLSDNPFITDGDVEPYRKSAENEVNSSIYSRYTLPLTNTTTMGYEVPALIERCTILLAAGYMDYREYGNAGVGVKWLGEARGILNALKKGTQRLIASDDNEFLLKELTQGVQSADNNNEPRFFSKCQLF